MRRPEILAAGAFDAPSVPNQPMVAGCVQVREIEEVGQDLADLTPCLRADIAGWLSQALDGDRANVPTSGRGGGGGELVGCTGFDRHLGSIPTDRRGQRHVLDHARVLVEHELRRYQHHRTRETGLPSPWLTEVAS